METLPLILIIISAVMHAGWNLLVKRSTDKTIFIWWMFVSSGALFNLVVWSRPGAFPVPSAGALELAAAGAVCFVLYHLLNGRAYRSGDLSLIYPLSQTSMVYVPLWGIYVLGEQLSFMGVVGIVLIICGDFMVQMRTFHLAELLRPFKNLGNRSVQAALAAGLIYSFGAVIDKQGVDRYSATEFTYLLVMFMLLFMSLNLMRPKYRGRILAEWHQNKVLILISGPVMLGSFLCFRYGLQLSPMSYAVPVRQVSILISVLMGILFLGEPSGRVRISAAMLILIGVVSIRLG